MYYGYVDLQDPSQVDEAIERLSNTNLMGREIRIEKYLENREKESFFHQDDDGNIPLGERISDHSRDDYGDRAYQLHVSFKAQILGKEGITEDDLRDMFLPFGPILDVIIKKHVFDSENRLGGYAFIQFEKDESAVEAIRSIHNQIIGDIHYNCRLSKKHQTRSGSFDTTVASDSPSLSKRNQRFPHRPQFTNGNQGNRYVHAHAPSFAPAPYYLSGSLAPTGYGTAAPAIPYQSPGMMPGSYSDDMNSNNPMMMMPRFPNGMLVPPPPPYGMFAPAPMEMYFPQMVHSQGGYPVMMPGPSQSADEQGDSNPNQSTWYFPQQAPTPQFFQQQHQQVVPPPGMMPAPHVPQMMNTAYQRTMTSSTDSGANGNQRFIATTMSTLSAQQQQHQHQPQYQVFQQSQQMQQNVQQIQQPSTYMPNGHPGPSSHSTNDSAATHPVNRSGLVQPTNHHYDGTDTENSPSQQFLTSEQDSQSHHSHQSHVSHHSHQSQNKGFGGSASTVQPVGFGSLPESAVTAAAFVPQQVYYHANPNDMVYMSQPSFSMVPSPAGMHLQQQSQSSQGQQYRGYNQPGTASNGRQSNYQPQQWPQQNSNHNGHRSGGSNSYQS